MAGSDWPWGSSADSTNVDGAVGFCGRCSRLVSDVHRLTSQQVLDEHAGLTTVVLDWLLWVDGLRRIDTDEMDPRLHPIE